MMLPQKPSDSEANLHGVQPRIHRGQSSIGDVQVAEFDAPVVFVAEEMRAQRGGGGEVDVICKSGNVVVGEEYAAAEFEIWGEASVALEIPLQAKRVDT